LNEGLGLTVLRTIAYVLFRERALVVWQFGKGGSGEMSEDLVIPTREACAPVHSQDHFEPPLNELVVDGVEPISIFREH